MIYKVIINNYFISATLVTATIIYIRLKIKPSLCNIIKNNLKLTLLVHNYDFFKKEEIWNIKIQECFINDKSNTT